MNGAKVWPMSAFAARLGEGRRSARGQKKTFAMPLRMSARSRLAVVSPSTRERQQRVRICRSNRKNEWL